MSQILKVKGHHGLKTKTKQIFCSTMDFYNSLIHIWEKKSLDGCILTHFLGHGFNLDEKKAKDVGKKKSKRCWKKKALTASNIYWAAVDEANLVLGFVPFWPKYSNSRSCPSCWPKKKGSCPSFSVGTSCPSCWQKKRSCPSFDQIKILSKLLIGNRNEYISNKIIRNHQVFHVYYNYF